MNKKLKEVNIEKVLFFDCENVRKSKELNINSKEFELYRKKIRNKETDQLLEPAEVVEDYNKRAALKMGYIKIVSIGIGMIKDGIVYLKSLEGTEEELIKQFCDISASFDYVCGANIIGYDLPVLINNGFKYFDVSEHLLDKFNTSGKKVWELKNVIDLLDIFRGSHYVNNSLDELCYHFDLPSPKTDLDGSKVSEEYYTNGLEKINQYVKQDVFASINVFQKMRFDKPFETFVDRNTPSAQKEEEEIFTKAHVLERINNSPQITEEQKEELIKKLTKVKIAKKDLPYIKEMLEKIYISCEMFKGDGIAVVERKKQEIDEILKQFV